MELVTNEEYCSDMGEFSALESRARLRNVVYLSSKWATMGLDLWQESRENFIMGFIICILHQCFGDSN
jgi:hypothetical protein